jgi:hypothetical protein
MNGHSPGPWKFTKHRQRFDDGDTRRIESGGEEPLMCDEQFYPSCPIEDADWHLIAAAPDMLAALKKRLHYDDCECGACSPMQHVIAKAEGKI